MKNQVILIGYVGSAPISRTFPSGDTLTSISIATNEKWHDSQSGEMKDHTEWHRVVFRDRGNFKLGVRANTFIQKGAKLFVQGALRTRRWEKDGETQQVIEIDADEFLLLDKMKSNSNSIQVNENYTNFRG